MSRTSPRRLSGLPALLALCAVSALGQVTPATQPAVSTPQPSGPSEQPATPKAKADPERAEQAYLAGARLLRAKDLEGAQTEFAKAAALNPGRSEFGLALDLTREHRVSELIQQAAKERLLQHPDRADALLTQARTLDPGNELVLEHSDQPSPAQPPHGLVATTPEIGFAGPLQLVPNDVRTEQHLRGDIRQVLTQLTASYGLKVTFDESVGTQPVRFDLDARTYREAMPILLHMGHLFATPIDAKTVLVAKDTEENRQRLERQVEETLYVPALTNEQINELINIVKNVYDVKQVIAAPSSGTLILRAPEETLKAVNYTLADLVDGGAEVAVELKLLEVDKSISRNLGVVPPNSVGTISVAGEAQSIVANNASAVSTLISSGAYVPTGNSATDTIAEAVILVLSGVVTDANVSNLLALFGGGLTLFGVNVGSGATLNLALSSADTRALDDITVRLGDKQTSTLRIGEKYPITTSTYSSGLSSAQTSALAGQTVNGVSVSSLLSAASAAATIPIIQYEDLGITLKTTPTVLKSGLISMHIDLKIEALTGGLLDNIPILTSRAFVSDIMLQDGSSAVMLSDLSKTESSAVTGIPGLSELPGFSQTTESLRETDSSELLLLVTPHLVRRRSNSIASRPIVFHSSVPVEY